MNLYQDGGQEDDTLTALRRARMSPAGSSPLGGGGTSPVAPPQPLMPQPRPTSPTAPGGAPSAPGGAPAPAAGGGGAPATTFAQLQANGIARPAPPTPTPVTPSPAPAPAANGTELAGSPGVTPFGGGMVNDTTGAEPQPLKPGDDPNSPGGGEGGTPLAPGGPPGEPPGGTPTPPATPGSTKYPLQDDIEAQIKKLLGMGSPYDDAAFQNDVGREYNKIDDQYTMGQKDLGDNLARRGLGAAGDSTIGLGKMSDLNVGRKSAKETVLSDLASKRATTQMDDLARVLGLATNYGQGAQALTLEQQQQQFNTQMQIAQLLAQLGYKTPAPAGR